MRNQLLRSLITFFFFYSIVFSSGCAEFPTIRLASNLQQRLKQEEFERIYNDSSLELRRSIGKQEFIDKLKDAVAVMRKADPELNWRIGQANGDSYVDGERGLKYYFAERVLGPEGDYVWVLIGFTEETKGVAKLAAITVKDPSKKPETTVSIP